jgi:hypothetical protein
MSVTNHLSLAEIQKTLPRVLGEKCRTHVPVGATPGAFGLVTPIVFLSSGQSAPHLFPVLAAHECGCVRLMLDSFQACMCT